MSDAPRPKQHLIAAARLYPGAWRLADSFRAGRGRDLPDWPEWCYLPLAGWHAIVSADAGVPRLDAQHLHLVADVGRLAALGTWRMSQGIYRFDPDLFAALVDTPLTGDLPCDLFYRLPEWCVYVETPGLRWLDSELYGFFAHLEWDANDGRAELRLLIDSATMLLPLPLHLGSWTLNEAVNRMMTEAAKYAPISKQDTAQPAILKHLPALISLLLYLCSENADLPSRPANPQPKRTKHGWRRFAPAKTRVWEVGVRLGAALRNAHTGSTPGGGAHARPRPHIRRAHWHTYLVGEGRTQRRLKWLPPMAVAVEDVDALPATIRSVD